MICNMTMMFGSRPLRVTLNLQFVVRRAAPALRVRAAGFHPA
jgi:hypothetical protein